MGLLSTKTTKAGGTHIQKKHFLALYLNKLANTLFTGVKKR